MAGPLDILCKMCLTDTPPWYTLKCPTASKGIPLWQAAIDISRVVNGVDGLVAGGPRMISVATLKLLQPADIDSYG